MDFIARLMLIGSALWLAAAVTRADDEKVNYLRDVKPVLAQRCYVCHGGLKQKARLRLDTARSILKGGESGPALIRGTSRKSRILEAVTVKLSHYRVHAKDCAECESEEGMVSIIDRGLELQGDLDEGQRERLHEIADRCPVHRTLTSEIRIR